MPVYQYTCRDCGTPLEVHQEFSDAALTECPVCGGRLRKQYGSIGVTFNGSGFYRNDSRAGSGEGGSKGSGDAGTKESGSKSDAKSGSGDSGSSTTKTESAKPAASASTSSSAGGGSTAS